MRKYSYFLLFFLLVLSCNQNPSQVEKNYIKNLEEKNRALEKELQEMKTKVETTKTPGKKQMSEGNKEYFTIGSTIDEVIEVMGDPTTYIDFGSSGKRFHYGMSTIFFEKGKVESYNNVEGNLKVRIKK